MFAANSSLSSLAQTMTGLITNDQGSSKYADLDQINKETVQDLQVVWREVHWQRPNIGSTPICSCWFQTTPIHKDGTLYISTSLGNIVAIDGMVVVTAMTFDTAHNTARLGTWDSIIVALGHKTKNNAFWWRQNAIVVDCRRDRQPDMSLVTTKKLISHLTRKRLIAHGIQLPPPQLSITNYCWRCCADSPMLDLKFRKAEWFTARPHTRFWC